MSTVTTAPATDRTTVAGIELEGLRRGAGHPLLLLHGFQQLDPRLPVVERRAREMRVGDGACCFIAIKGRPARP